MPKKGRNLRILLLYVSDVSGHRQAAKAIKKAGHQKVAGLFRFNFFPPSVLLRGRGGSFGIDAYLLALFVFAFEGDESIDLGEDGEIPPDPHVVAWVDPRSELADDDGAAGNPLAAECLDAVTAPCGIASVSGRAACFFMSHLLRPSFSGFSP